MVIKEVLSCHRNDFTATMLCEFCGHKEHNPFGYNDDFYLTQVIPAMECRSCGKKSKDMFENKGE